MRILCTAALVFTCLIGSAQINFQDMTWKDALKKAKSEDKILFLSGTTSWCEPCQLLNQYTFSDLEVANFFNSNFINLQLDMEEYPGVELTETYDIRIYPAMLFINSKGEIVHRGCGAMDANELLELGNSALGSENLLSQTKIFYEGEYSTDFLLGYLATLEEVCLDAERLAQDLLAKVTLEELTSDHAFVLLESYQWDVFSREFKYLVENKEAFVEVYGSDRIHDKIFNTYLAQYQEVFEAEDLHLFGLKALQNEVGNTTFIGSDTLLAMMNLHYYEITEDWSAYADAAILWVGMTQTEDPEELGDLAWKFYLFVADKAKLQIASNWAKLVVSKEPSPTAIDTYASLLYKQGQKKKAIELEKQAIEMATQLSEDVDHYDHQLAKFQGN